MKSSADTYKIKRAQEHLWRLWARHAFSQQDPPMMVWMQAISTRTMVMKIQQFEVLVLLMVSSLLTPLFAQQERVKSIFEFHAVGEPCVSFKERCSQVDHIYKQLWNPENQQQILTFQAGLEMEYKEKPKDDLTILGVRHSILQSALLAQLKVSFFVWLSSEAGTWWAEK